MRVIAGVTPRWQDTKVFLFGHEIHNCVEADSGEGWADVLVADDVGQPVIEGDALKTERIFGDVSLRSDASLRSSPA